MAVDQETVTKILTVLSHPLRRQILRYLSEKQECSFTDLMNALDVDTGKLSFHIKSLEVFLEQTPTSKYKLSKVGENAIVLIKDLEAWSVEAEIAKKTTSLPLARIKDRAIAFLIDFAIVFALFMAAIVPSSLAVGVGVFLNFNVILFFLILWLYLTLLEGFAGQTLGKRLVGLKVVTTSEKRLFYDHAAVRNFGVAFLFLLPIDLLIGLRLKDERYIRYFDKFAGTTVIDLRGRNRESKKETDKELETARAASLFCGKTSGHPSYLPESVSIDI